MNIGWLNKATQRHVAVERRPRNPIKHFFLSHAWCEWYTSGWLSLCVSVCLYLWWFECLLSASSNTQVSQVVYTYYCMFACATACFPAHHNLYVCVLFTKLCAHSTCCFFECMYICVCLCVYAHVCVIRPQPNTLSNRAHWDMNKSTVAGCKLTGCVCVCSCVRSGSSSMLSLPHRHTKNTHRHTPLPNRAAVIIRELSIPLLHCFPKGKQADRQTV